MLGSYRVLAPLGEGGMGSVWLAEHTAIGRKAAIKVLHPEYAVKEEVVQRFFNEARAANLVQHPSIVDIYDYGQAPDVGAYIVMEFLKGESLAARLERAGPMPPRRAATIVARVASAVGAAHASDLVHRDLKPDNLFLVPDPDHPGDERVKVLDFGVAKLIEAGPRAGVVTGTGQVLGTPRYMSPEQCDGAKSIDARSDIYALGVIAYELLCGRPPFVAEGWGEMMVQQITVDPPRLASFRPGIPAALEDAVLVALAKDPARRYQTMAEMAEALLSAVDLVTDEDEATVGPPAAATSRAGPTPHSEALAPTMDARTPSPLGIPARRGAPPPGDGGPPAPARPSVRPPSTLSASAVELRRMEQPPARRLALIGVGAAALLALGVVIGAAALSGRGGEPANSGPASGATAAASASAGTSAAGPASGTAAPAATAAAPAPTAAAAATTTAPAPTATAAATAAAPTSTAAAVAGAAAAAATTASTTATPKSKDPHKKKKALRSAAPDDLSLPD